MGDASFWLKGLGHMIKAGGLALFEGATDEVEEERPEPRRRPAGKKPTKNCCLAPRAMPRVRESGDD